MREVTVGDNWTGNSRLKPEVQKAVVDMTTLVLGRNAFKYLVTAEKGWQAAVSVAKNTIVIRSIIVPASNMASNVIQLMTNGVGLNIQDWCERIQQSILKMRGLFLLRKMNWEINAA